jgi:GMP synthase (glutamine-hydrolysing)
MMARKDDEILNPKGSKLYVDTSQGFHYSDRHTPEPIREQHGDLPHWFCNALDIEPDRIEVVKVYEGAELPKPDAGSVAVITGSWDMVTDKLPGVNLQRRDTARNKCWHGGCLVSATGISSLCVCVGRYRGLPPGWTEVGCHDISLNQAGMDDPLVGQFPQRFKAHLTHMQTVISLPPGAQVLASSAHDPHQIVRYGPKVLFNPISS